MGEMRVLITGATGFVGRALVASLLERGDSVAATSRDPRSAGLPEAVELLPLPRDAAGWAAALAGREAVINLAGAPIAVRWSAAYKQTLYDSRVRLTRLLAEGLAAADPRPELLISASAVGYYGTTDDDRELTEDSTSGDDFLAGLCRDWEAAALQAASDGVRVVLPRIGIVLDRDGGALAKMLLPFRLCLGGPVGHGRQWLSWIHRADLVRLLLWAADHPQISGPLNATAPAPQTNRDFSRTLARVLHRPCLLPLPGFVLRLGLNEGALLVTRGQRVLPTRALELGFEFLHPELQGALEAILS